MKYIFLQEHVAPFFKREEVVSFLGNKMNKRELLALLIRDSAKLSEIFLDKNVEDNVQIPSSFSVESKSIQLFPSKPKVLEPLSEESLLNEPCVL